MEKSSPPPATLRQVMGPFLPLTSIGFCAIRSHVLCRMGVIHQALLSPKTSHPIDHYAEREAHIAHLNMILRLLRAREQARGQ